MAFGTGDHPTTQLCLEKLFELRERGLKPKRILDLGTGTGVLALASRKFFPEAKISAIDLDPQCEENFLKNFELNQENPHSINQGFGSSGDIRSVQENFDLVVSNIYAEVLASLLPEIDRVLDSQCLWITSGILKGPSESHLLEKSTGGTNPVFKVQDRQTRDKDGDTWVMIEFLKMK
jgi:ribosomal protein L11 methyltransferase